MTDSCSVFVPSEDDTFKQLMAPQPQVEGDEQIKLLQGQLSTFTNVTIKATPMDDNSRPKTNNYRNRRLLNLAHRVTECMFGLPTCIGHVAHGCEPIHSDHSIHGKGAHIKAADDMHVAGCHNCHLYYSDASNFKDRDERITKFLEARERTFTYYRKFNWLNKVGYADKRPN